MNDDRNLERDVASLFAETAPSRCPDDLLENVFLTTGPKRPRPRWLARIKEPPMRYTNSLAVGSSAARVAAIMVATLLLAIMVAGAGIGGSRLLAAEGTIVVDQSGGGTVTTISEAVAMAEDGDTILVKPGTYDESVTITKDITIRGDGDRDQIVVEVSAEMPANAVEWDFDPELPRAFLFEASDATLEHLTLRGDSSGIVIFGRAPTLRDLFHDGAGHVYGIDPGTTVPSGLWILDGSTALIEDSVLSDTSVSVEIGASPTIQRSEFRDESSIWMQGTGVDPIIRDNVMEGTRNEAIGIWGGARPRVQDNTISGFSTGIDIQDTGWRIPDTGTDPLILGNTITGATTSGITVDTSSLATIEDNELLDNTIGISMSRSDATVEGNTIGGGRGGILIGGSSTLVDNAIEGAGGIGIAVSSGSSPALIGNTSCNNGTNLTVADGATPDIDDTNEICEDTPPE